MKIVRRKNSNEEYVGSKTKIKFAKSINEGFQPITTRKNYLIIQPMKQYFLLYTISNKLGRHSLFDNKKLLGMIISSVANYIDFKKYKQDAF